MGCQTRHLGLGFRLLYTPFGLLYTPLGLLESPLGLICTPHGPLNTPLRLLYPPFGLLYTPSSAQVWTCRFRRALRAAAWMPAAALAPLQTGRSCAPATPKARSASMRRPQESVWPRPLLSRYVLKCNTLNPIPYFVVRKPYSHSFAGLLVLRSQIWVDPK